MTVATPNKIREAEIGASLFAPVAPEDFYRAVLDVRGFPAWAPGVRRVEVLSGEGEAGMASEWEIFFFGLRSRVRSTLEEAESPTLLRWTYDGPILGWGECSVTGFGGGALAEFRTALTPADPLLAGLMRSGTVQDTARAHLKRSLRRLGRFVAGDETRVLVGPIAEERPRPRGQKAEEPTG
jgi:hypothetical protein